MVKFSWRSSAHDLDSSNIDSSSTKKQQSSKLQSTGSKTFDTSKSATKAIEGTPNKPNPALNHSTNAILVGIFLTLLGGAF